MDDDKVFAAWALALFASVASVLTATVVTGIATLPSPVVFAEHLLMALGVRAAYKSFGGVTWPAWLAELGATRETTEAAAEPDGATADAIG